MEDVLYKVTQLCTISANTSITTEILSWVLNLLSLNIPKSSQCQWVSSIALQVYDIFTRYLRYHHGQLIVIKGILASNTPCLSLFTFLCYLVIDCSTLGTFSDNVSNNYQQSSLVMIGLSPWLFYIYTKIYCLSVHLWVTIITTKGSLLLIVGYTCEWGSVYHNWTINNWMLLRCER